MEVTFSLADKIDPVALYAAVISTMVAIVEILKWFREGPRLRTQVNMTVIPVGTPDHFKEIYSGLSVTNVGNASTKLTSLYISCWPNLLCKTLNKRRTRAVVMDPTLRGTSYRIPQQLNPGDDWMGVVVQSDLKNFEKYGRVYFELHHTARVRPLLARVKF